MRCNRNVRVLGRRVIVSSVCTFLVIYFFHLNTNLHHTKSSPNYVGAQQLVHSTLCSSKLVGWKNLSVEVTTAILNEDESSVESKMREAGVQPGGRYKPMGCKSQHKVAIVVAVRNRTDHLAIFLRYMHPFLQRQQLDYVIIVVEQSERSEFNRGMLMNIGFNEAQFYEEKYHCFILHDVDMLPEDDGNLYTCSEEGDVRHMAFCIDDDEDCDTPKKPHKVIPRIFQNRQKQVNLSRYSNLFRLPHPVEHMKKIKSVGWKFFGGATAISASDFQRINGYSNAFWGWGGEDELLYDRVLASDLAAFRTNNGTPSRLLHYRTLAHEKVVRIKALPDPIEMIKERRARFKTDGLADIRYKRLALQLKPLYTHILVEIEPYDVAFK